ncbi:hypothetical protein HGRIS_003038 [Hohenbuehelia grisea]|uniref:Cytochrome b561 domain-containing protein n=1 Tax=Hohenbuehelia grisea TaxID=104357 RepID=A0ABR3JPD7_9AGAR
MLLFKTLVAAAIPAVALASSDYALAARQNTLTGDSACGETMCISGTLNGSQVTWVLQSRGSNTVGWMAMGFGRSMLNSPMVIAWSNADGSITLSQRIVSRHVMPTVDPNPPRAATLLSAQSLASGNRPKFTFVVPLGGVTTQDIIYAFATANPGSSAKDAPINRHIEDGKFTFNLAKPISATSSAADPAGTGIAGPSTGIPLTQVQRIVVVHAIFCVVGFLVLLPIGVLLARYLRTFWPKWFLAHWIAQFLIAGPAIVTGVALGIRAVSQANALHFDSTHKRWGIAIFSLYCFQVALGTFIHFVKPKQSYKARDAHPAKRRPLQNYAHAIIGILIIAFALYQVRTGYRDEWPNTTGRGEVDNSINVIWYVWIVLLPVLYLIGLSLLPRQWKQEAAGPRGPALSGDDDDLDHINMSSRYRDYQ